MPLRVKAIGIFKKDYKFEQAGEGDALMIG
jgi:hypothetical protein